MKWVNHRALTGVLAYAVSSDLLFCAGAIFGSIVPDKVEGRRQNLSYAVWRKRHRGLSHWLLLYIALFFAIAQLFNVDNLYDAINDRSHPLRLIFALLFGVFCHIWQDALCGKVPTVTPNIKWGIRLFKVGSLLEYIFVTVLILLIFVIKFI